MFNVPLLLKKIMTNDTATSRLGTADRHLISIIGDQVSLICMLLNSF